MEPRPNRKRIERRVRGGVVAGLAPLAEGSDGAASIRIPAAMCGAFGFKPTFGRVPDVSRGFSSHTPFFHNGPNARSVADACLLYPAIARESSEIGFLTLSRAKLATA